MWIPANAAELERGLLDGSLPHESASFEVKAQLPVSASNSDIAVDVAAMSTDGGVIIYGVIEDKVTVTYTASPIPLQGVNDRISNIIVDTVKERVDFAVHLRPLASDSSMGYVVIDVPASVRAPHMVEVRGEYRYYGRAPGGNIRLTETQVAQLYERRRNASSNALRALDEAIACCPWPPDAERRGDFHFVARPLLSDESLRMKALVSDDTNELVQELNRVCSSLRFVKPWDPKLVDLFNGGVSRTTIDGVAFVNRPTGANGEPLLHWTGQIEVLNDGTVRYFHGALIRESDPSSGLHLREVAAQQLTAQLARLAGRVLERGDYHGAVDVSIQLSNIAGATSAVWLDLPAFTLAPRPIVPLDDFRSSARVSVERLLDDPVGISRELFERLTRVISPTVGPDLLALVASQ